MTQLDILGKLFGSMTKLKLLKFFLLNQDEGFSVPDIAARLRVKPPVIRPELNALEKLGFIKSKVVTAVTLNKRTKKEIKKRVPGYIANSDFTMREPLRNLVIESGGMHIPELPGRFNKVGKIGLFVVSGIFLHDDERSMDLMIVGEKLDRKLIDRRILELESEIGKELRYAIFDTSEFIYRLNMYDKLLRDMLDYPHEKLISKIEHPELRR
jgi:DNA-binding transcriptional regulator YhcF (GntR family)